MSRFAAKLAATSPFTRAALLFVLALQVLRFYGVDQSPPGFYVDEAVGSAQVLCIRETGSDFFGDRLPLFSPGLGAGFYTPPYVYGQVLWTSVFGDSIASFRSFVALATVLTLLVFGLYLRRVAGGAIALWFLILGTISPWSWQFSRIAWDPPLAPLFLALGMLFFTNGRKWGPWVSGIFFALAAYAYPPTRLQAGVFLLLMPGVSWRQTFQACATFAVALVPLLIRSLDEDFGARARLVAIWSQYPGNPYKDESIFGLVLGVIKNVFLHLTPEFLLLRGDANLRHSTQQFGMISWPEAFGLVWTMVCVAWARIRRTFTPAEWSLVWIGVIGVVTGLVPASMTWESVPHSLRAITAWPFFCLLAAVGITRFLGARRHEAWKWAALAGCAAFSWFYLSDYFGDYPERSRHWFQTEDVPVARAYERMTGEGISCEKLPR